MFQPSLELTSSALAGQGDGAVRRTNATALPNGRVQREAASFRLTAGPSAGLVLSQFGSTATYDDGAADGIATKSFGVNYTGSAPWTQGQQVGISLRELFTGFDRNLGTYTAGMAEFGASDGSAWRLDAGNGDPATFRLEIMSGNNTRTVTLPWDAATGIRLPCVSGRGSDGAPTPALQRCESTFSDQ